VLELFTNKMKYLHTCHHGKSDKIYKIKPNHDKLA